MTRRKNTKFIDPRYFMDEKTERLDEAWRKEGSAWDKIFKLDLGRGSAEENIVAHFAKAWLYFLFDTKGIPEDELLRLGANWRMMEWGDFVGAWGDRPERGSYYELASRGRGYEVRKYIEQKGQAAVIRAKADEILKMVREE